MREGVYFTGLRRADGSPVVFKMAARFDPAPSQKVRNHSPCGFEWGYEGSGPAQLALAILLEVLPETAAVELYQDFKRQRIATIPQGNSWTIWDYDVETWAKNRPSRASSPQL